MDQRLGQVDAHPPRGLQAALEFRPETWQGLNYLLRCLTSLTSRAWENHIIVLF